MAQFPARGPYALARVCSSVSVCVLCGTECCRECGCDLLHRGRNSGRAERSGRAETKGGRARREEGGPARQGEGNARDSTRGGGGGNGTPLCALSAEQRFAPKCDARRRATDRGTQLHFSCDIRAGCVSLCLCMSVECRWASPPRLCAEETIGHAAACVARSCFPLLLLAPRSRVCLASSPALLVRRPPAAAPPTLQRERGRRRRRRGRQGAERRRGVTLRTHARVAPSRRLTDPRWFDCAGVCRTAGLFAGPAAGIRPAVPASSEPHPCGNAPLRDAHFRRFRRGTAAE